MTIIKPILNFLPRTLLIKISIIIRPILKIYYNGSKFIDPIDGSGYRKFLPYGYNIERENALCPGTFSLERHRYLWLYLINETNFTKQKLKVLHIAPEQVFHTKFKKNKNWNYTTLDLFSPLADVKADICDLPFEKNKFDLIICNHVLEHIDNDLLAIKELYRVLKKGGCGIFQVPINENSEKTFQNNKITDFKKRTEVFGQYDHLRVYGKDYYSLLRSVGFKVNAVDYLKKIDPKLSILYCLPKNEKIPIVYKN
ncbi:MAG: class I SAM-dependent methyltransferase [Flavobacteriaceae bacterium]|nr:class I SAM-dependent methyltransferase [Flavobacteriaceae bacterium]